MPRGVNEQFLRVLDHERRRCARGLVLGVGAATLLLFIAELADMPRFGRDVALYVSALTIGTAAGLLYAHARSRRREERLRGEWSAWMRMSSGSRTIAEIDAKVRHRAPIPSGAWALLVLAVGALNGVLFAFLWFDPAQAGTLSAVTCLVNGLVVGSWMGSLAWHFNWVARFGRALDALLAEGSVGLWGER